MVQPHLSIVCVTFNAEKHIKTFMQSIENNKPVNAELIIFDGKSTDNTIEIIKSFGDLTDKIFIEKDSGIYDAMNRAVKNASGKWVYFIGADDEITSDFPIMTAEFQNPNTIYHGNIAMDDMIIVRSANPYKLSKENISHQTIFYPRSVFSQYRYNDKYRICADYELNIKLRGDNNYRYEYIPLTPAKFGTQGLSSLNIDTVFEKDKIAIVRQNLGIITYLRLLFKRFKNKNI